MEERLVSLAGENPVGKLCEVYFKLQKNPITRRVIGFHDNMIDLKVGSEQTGESVCSVFVMDVRKLKIIKE